MDVLTPISEIPNSGADYSELLTPRRKPSRPKQDNGAEKIESIGVPEGKSTGTRTSWSSEDINTLSGIAALILVELTKSLSYWQVDDETLAMDELESQVISKAATSIILRRIKIKGAKRGDVSDGLLILLTLASYGVRFNNGRRKYLKEKEEADAKEQANRRS